MEFEEMKVIWDSQNKKQLYVLDEEALHATVRRKGQCIEKSVMVFEGLMIGILLLVALILIGRRLVYEPSWQTSMLIGAGLTLMVAVVASIYLAAHRVQRLKREQVFDQSLLGDINKAISQVDYHVSRLKAIHYWFILPMAAMIGFNFLMKGVSITELFDSKIWILPLFLIAVLINYAAIWFEISIFHAPRKRSLETLRQKLVAEN